MAFQPFQGAEPIPGYTLISRLGTGGYGEVWKTTAPGGLDKAIKFVYGAIEASQADQELKALSRIKQVRHPFLLSLERYEVVHDQLVIVIELAEKSLIDRFKECREDGAPGVPRDELLVYMSDAADALDYMSENYGLQHLDIKPQNLLLIGGRVKIADFGLVKDLQGATATATGGVTPLYATPEAFDGRVSRHSDQYSLAIVYQEMLSGVRPFSGTTMLQLANQHLNLEPTLDSLPFHDRPVIERALAKEPEMRFSGCREMVALLRSAGVSEPVVGGVDAPSPASRQATNTLAPTPDAFRPTMRNSQLPAGAVAETTGQPHATETDDSLPGVVPAAGNAGVTGASESLRPTVVVGIGGIAGAVLRRLKNRLFERFGDAGPPSILRLLLIDSDRETIRLHHHGALGERLDPEETLLTPLRPPEHYRADSKKLLTWIERRWLFGIPRSLVTNGVRSLGRLAVIDNATTVVDRLRKTLESALRPESIADTVARTEVRLRDRAPRILVVASTIGGTGSGMLQDVADALRRILAEEDRPAGEVSVFLAHATGTQTRMKEVARANAYATLTELNHSHRSDRPVRSALFEDDEDSALGANRSTETYLVRLGDDLDERSFESSTDVLADYLYLDVATPFGAALEQYRRQTEHYAQGESSTGACLRTCGLHRITVPRHRVTKLAALTLCRGLVGRWLGELDGASYDSSRVTPWDGSAPHADDPVREEMRRRARQLSLQMGLDTDSLSIRIKAVVELALGDRFEEDLQQRLRESVNEYSTIGSSNPLTVLLDSIHTRLGAGSTSEAQTAPPPTEIERQVADKVELLRNELTETVAEWIESQVENPRRRLRCTEHAADWLAQCLYSAVEDATARRHAARAKRVQLAQRLVDDERRPPTIGGWFVDRRRLAFVKRSESALLEYARYRIEEIALYWADSVLRTVQARVAVVRDGLMGLRERLGRLSESRTESFDTAKADPVLSGADVTELFPHGADNPCDAAVAVLDSFGPDYLERFDERFQSEFLDHEGGLAGLDSTDNEAADRVERVDRVEREMVRRSWRMVAEKVDRIDAAGLFLESNGRPEAAKGALSELVDRARPRLATRGAWEGLLVATPPGTSGAALREMIAALAPDASIAYLESTEGDVILCFEVVNLAAPLLLDQLLGEAAPYAELSRRMMSRNDIDWMPIRDPEAP